MLRNRLPEIEVPQDDPFKNDKLGRKDSADAFSTVIKHCSSTGCVIALNGEWGSGKTTFVKMFMQKMENEGGHPLYFNAWENDYVSDPFIALLSELKELYPESDNWNNVISSGCKILTSMAVAAGKNILKNKIGIDSDAVRAGIEEVGNLLKKDLDDYANYKTSFAEFRNALEEYIADNKDNEYPIVFFIDELDRCNPRFAVLVLERIKHLFDIPNIIFVLSVNKKQLEYAINGYYGSADIDSKNYLRRFIDIEYSLPIPNAEDFCRYLYDMYNYSEVFNQEGRVRLPEFQSDEDSFQRISKILISSLNFDLRTTDKIFAHTRLALSGFRSTSNIVPDVFFLLCFMRVAYTELYQNIIKNKYTVQELLYEIEEYLPHDLTMKDEVNFIWKQMTYTISSLLYMYSFDDEIKVRNLFVNTKEGMDISLHTNVLDRKTVRDALIGVSSQRGMIPLKYLIRRIELLQIH